MSKYKTKLPTVEEMLDAGVHFGHQVKRKNPKMDQYVFGVEDKTHIIDLYKTHEYLEKACDALYDIAKSGAEIIFVGTKRQASDIVKTNAMDAGAMYVVQRWLGGTLTNYESVKNNWTELERLEEGMKTGAFNHYTKKERLLINRKIEKLESFVGGIRNMSRKPGALVVVDVKREKTAVREANANNIPVFGLVDTNSDPENIDYIIPANDDAMKSIELFIKVLASVVKEGYAESKKSKPAKSEQKSATKVEKETARKAVKETKPSTKGKSTSKKVETGKKTKKTEVKGADLELDKTEIEKKKESKKSKKVSKKDSDDESEEKIKSKSDSKKKKATKTKKTKSK